jgi:phenylalanyl-tRNA synthetase beta chain
MKISLQWMKDYVNLPVDAQVIEKLTMSGLEVEAVERPADALKGVVVARVLTADKHPNAEKLSVTTVDRGTATPLQIVCGAKNFKVGDVVPLATVGSRLPNGTDIKAAKLRDVDSFGMLCSAKELGLSDESSGLMILSANLKPGTLISEALMLDDTVLTLNVTPNRGDALSMLGVARELSALFGTPLRKPKTLASEPADAAKRGFDVRVEDSKKCFRYSARIVDNVTVAASPDWLVRRLASAGVRSINVVVDVTNYVMLECGQPLHAFDLSRLAGGNIVVRSAKAQERLVTLDEKERVLDVDDLLITDGVKPLVLAGVMGGLDSGVTAVTKSVLLESAVFDAASVRRTSKRHQLHSESSHRFERGVDAGQVTWALDRAAQLLVELAGGTARTGVADVVTVQPRLAEVDLRLERVAQVLGVAVDEARAVEVLKTLDFQLKSKAAGTLRFVVPTHRNDVSVEVDLIEELARIIGYDTVPEVLPPGPKTLEPPARSAQVERLIRLAMSGNRFDEVINYSFVSSSELKGFGGADEAIALENPLSVEQSLMRTTLFAGLLGNVVRARRFSADGVKLYELGRSYRPNLAGGEGRNPAAIETLELAGVLWGARDFGRTWTQPEAGSRLDFFDAKAAVETALKALHIDGLRTVAFDSPVFHPRASAQVLVGEAVVGEIGELHPVIAKQFDVGANVYLFRLDVDKVATLAKVVPQARSIPKFPAVFRDLAVVVAQATAQDSVANVIREVGAPLVVDAQMFDVYQGEQLGEGKKNLAFALTYRSPDRTLTVDEVNQAHQAIVAEVTRRLGGALR